MCVVAGGLTFWAGRSSAVHLFSKLHHTGHRTTVKETTIGCVRWSWTPDQAALNKTRKTNFPADKTIINQSLLHIRTQIWLYCFYISFIFIANCDKFLIISWLIRFYNVKNKTFFSVVSLMFPCKLLHCICSISMTRSELICSNYVHQFKIGWTVSNGAHTEEAMKHLWLSHLTILPLICL